MRSPWCTIVGKNRTRERKAVENDQTIAYFLSAAVVDVMRETKWGAISNS